MAVRNRAFDSAQYMEFESAWFDLADSEKDAPDESDPEQTGLIAGCPEYIEDVEDYYSHTSRNRGNPGSDEWIISLIFKFTRPGTLLYG